MARQQLGQEHVRNSLMPWQEVRFGFLPLKETYRGDGWSAEPIEQLDKVIQSVLDSESCSGKWFYPPIVECPHEPSAKRKPLVPKPRFLLPCTHKLNYDPTRFGPEDVVLILHALGYAKGLLLQQEGWGHLYRAAVEPGLLSGFFCSPRRAGEIVDALMRLARQHEDDAVAGRNAVTAVLRWFLFSQSYTRAFEEFAGQYTVLDALCRLYEKTSGRPLSGGHSQRPESLCVELGVHPPSWLQRNRAQRGRSASALSELRNALVQEGRFGELAATIGVPEQRLLDSISWLHELNRSLILALVGAPEGQGEPIWGEYASLE